MPYPITEENGKHCVNGKCYDNHADALAYQRALEANVPDAKKQSEEHFADPKDKKLPIGTPEEVADAITALGPGFRGHKVTFDEGTKKTAIAAISKRIGELNISDDQKAHLRDRLSAVKELHGTPKIPLLFNRDKPGIVIYKGIDGQRLMFLVTSNSYKDREDETIATKALQSYVERAWRVEDKCLPDNPLIFWHEGNKRADIGDIIWTDMEGPFLLEVAKERRDKPITILTEKYVWHTTIKHLWDAIELATQKGLITWGASHGFKYPDSALEDGVYKEIRKFETSILPLDAAANPYTFAGVLNDMNKDQVLEKLTQLPGMAEKIRRGVRAVKSDLDKRGLEHKAFEIEQTKGIIDKLQATVDTFIAKIAENAPPDLKDQFLQAIIASLTSTVSADEPDTSGDQQMSTAYDSLGSLPTDDGKPVNEMMGKQLKFWETVLKGTESTMDAMSEMQKSFAATTETLQTVTKEVVAIRETVATTNATTKALDERVAAIEKKMAVAPRRASEADSTVVKDEDLTKKAAEALENGKEMFPGSGLIVHGYPSTTKNGKGG